MNTSNEPTLLRPDYQPGDRTGFATIILAHSCVPMCGSKAYPSELPLVDQTLFERVLVELERAGIGSATVTVADNGPNLKQIAESSSVDIKLKFVSVDDDCRPGQALGRTHQPTDRTVFIVDANTVRSSLVAEFISRAKSRGDSVYGRTIGGSANLYFGIPSQFESSKLYGPPKDQSVLLRDRHLATRVGREDDYWVTNLMMLRGRFKGVHLPGHTICVHEHPTLLSYVGDGVVIENQSVAEGCVLMAGASMDARSDLKHCVVMPGTPVRGDRLRGHILGLRRYLEGLESFTSLRVDGRRTA